jgi:RHS repeat-associated protein
MQQAGLVYLRARWYAAGSGTFTSRDPFAGYAQQPYSLHPYQYAYSDPLRWTDPSGENPAKCLVFAVVDGPAPIGDTVTVACFTIVGVTWLISTVAAVQSQDAIEDTASDLQRMVEDGGAGVHHTGNQEPPPYSIVVLPPSSPALVEPYIYTFVLGDQLVCEQEGMNWHIPSWRDSLILDPLPEQQAATVWTSSTTLKNRLGGVTGDAMQAHHLIPEALRTHRFVRRAIQAGWDHDQIYNGILLPNNDQLSRQLNLPWHRGRHRKYNTRVEQDLDTLEIAAQAGNWSNQQAYTELQQLAATLRNYLQGLGGGKKVD